MSAPDDPVATIALCWRLERRDGVTIGLTSHDRDLTIAGLVHRAAPGMTPSAIKRSEGLDADTMTAAGALTGDAITQGDLLAGRWDGARVAVSAIDWTTGALLAALGEGTIGAVELSGDGFSAELLGSTAALDRPAVETTSPECRAELGDRRCRVPLAGRRRVARVIDADDRVLTLDAAEPTSGAYADGRLRWLGGVNAGLESMIATSNGATVKLRWPPTMVPEEGTLIELTEGCDKSIATCAARFANAANFRGEPYLPGTDLLTRYPGA